MGIRPGNQGWTRSEAVFLAGVLVVLCSVLGPAAYWWNQQRLEGQVRQDFFRILDAAEQYYQDYQQWPTEYSGVFGDYRYGQSLSNAEVINILRAIDGPGNQDHAQNTAQTVYLEASSAEQGTSGLTDTGAYIDPWGNPYQIVVDTDLNNTCYINRSTYPPQIGYGILIWSYGLDGISDTRDDICSWRL